MGEGCNFYAFGWWSVTSTVQRTLAYSTVKGSEISRVTSPDVIATDPAVVAAQTEAVL